MASGYQIADGYNNAGAFVTMDVDGRPPRTPGQVFGRIRTNGEGVQREDGFRSATLIYSYLTADEYDTLVFTTMGFSASEVSNKVTIAIPDRDNRGFVNYNAVIALPTSLEFRLSKYLDVRFNVTRLEAI